jgi:transposase
MMDRLQDSLIDAEQRRLFSLPHGGPVSDTSLTESDNAPGSPRLKVPNREQIEFRACCWNDLLPADHQARVVWAYVKQLDLSGLYQSIKAVERRPGQPPIDPAILMALWLYATLRGIGSARELARRCGPRGEIPFQWICGGVSVNYHTLSDFRTAHTELLNDLLTQSIASLLEEGLVTLDRVAQDGMKVRASAGAASFRRRETLESHLEEARRQVEALQDELQADPAAANARQQAARERAAREREERLQKALEHLQEIEAQKQGAEDKAKARASTTDPEARVMKMADGGFRPAYNVQLATDTQTQIVEQHDERYGQTPGEMLVDGGFAKKDDITQVSPPHGNTTVYAPVQASKKADLDPHTPREGDSAAVAAWRQRMATEPAKEIYKQRAATAECVNAIARTRGGLYQFRVRGRPKVLAIILWQVLAHNLMRLATLRPELVGTAG